MSEALPPAKRPVPVCPLHDDPLDPPMIPAGTKDGREYDKCPKCSAEIDRPAPTDKP